MLNSTKNYYIEAKEAFDKLDVQREVLEGRTYNYSPPGTTQYMPTTDYSVD